MSINVEVDLRSDLLEVRDQGDLPTCLSHATSTVHQATRGMMSPFSAETLHYHATDANWSGGCEIPEVQRSLLDVGQPEDQYCTSISSTDIAKWEPPADVPFYQSNSLEKQPDAEIVINAIENSKLPVLGLRITEEFHKPKPPWVFSAGRPIGLHAVVAAGIANHNDGQIVLIRNSWGEDWADSGHAWLDQSFLEKHLKAVLILDGESIV